MRRREFLIDGGHAAIAVSVLSLAGCSRSSLPPAAPGAEALWKPLVAELEVQIPAWMAEGTVPGLSIAVIQHSQIVWRRGFGVRDAVSKEPVDDATVFEAQSMSKPVFAYAVMNLYEQGVIELDTPLTKYTSERLVTGDPRLDLITARRVLSHTSGLPNWRSKEDPLRINFTPGEKYSYSGEGYWACQPEGLRIVRDGSQGLRDGHRLLYESQRPGTARDEIERLSMARHL
jgi:CubicO group peptidase (beta-lactamase class C family)